MIQLRVSGLTDVGRARRHNEDCYEIDEDRHLFVVADGMGGHSHGEVASRIAVDTIRRVVKLGAEAVVKSRQGNNQHHQHTDLLGNAIRSAHDQVLRAIHRDGSLQGMGTTVVGLLLEDSTAALAHVGDSRAYRYRNGQLKLLTQDHTWVHEQVRAGYLSEEQARRHPLKNVVTRALGSEREVMVDVQEIEVEVGDLFLICSDGLTTMLHDSDIKTILSAGAPLDATCQMLVEESNARGGLDNVTVILIAADEVPVSGAAVPSRESGAEEV